MGFCPICLDLLIFPILSGDQAFDFTVVCWSPECIWKRCSSETSGTSLTLSQCCFNMFQCCLNVCKFVRGSWSFFRVLTLAAPPRFGAWWSAGESSCRNCCPAVTRIPTWCFLLVLLKHLFQPNVFDQHVFLLPYTPVDTVAHYLKILWWFFAFAILSSCPSWILVGYLIQVCCVSL